MDYKELLLTDEEIQAIICGYQVESSAIWNSDLSRNEKIIKVASLESVYRRVAKATAKKIMEWGKEPCPHHDEKAYKQNYDVRRECPECWEELQEGN